MVLFVYGSLLAGERHEAQLAGARRLGDARTEPAYTLVDLGDYPALVEQGTTAVAGELYEVDEETLRRLDAFEGHPDDYRRAAVRLAGAAQAEAYLYPRSRAAGMAVIAGGDWRRR
jgi:gamma-glutamylaminecyclotransferase